MTMNDVLCELLHVLTHGHRARRARRLGPATPTPCLYLPRVRAPAFTRLGHSCYRFAMTSVILPLHTLPRRRGQL
ncbi:MAG: hypothetical protein MUD06_08505 [Rhodospirillales bacterium]|jgi:hypothetical protein|nr:hypothetical protein [Rhodospirillales bacterium]